jgi:OmpA-OmpF porin, OOP family
MAVAALAAFCALAMAPGQARGDQCLGEPTIPASAVGDDPSPQCGGPSQCANGLDDDGDAYVDYPNDPDCSAASDAENVWNAPPPPPPPPPPPAPPPAPPPPPPPPPPPAAEKVTLAADALFDFDKATLRKDATDGLDALVGKLTGVTLEVIVLVGHTDSVGAEAYNQKLSVRRAEAVKAYLVSKGIEANRIYTEGKGESQPVADNKTAQGRAKNRRVDVEVVGTRAVRR